MSSDLEGTLSIGLIRINTETYRDYRASIDAVKDSARINRKLNLDVIVGPEWSLMNRRADEEPYSPEELKEVIDYFNEETRGTNTLFIPGTAVVRTRHGNIYNMLPMMQGYPHPSIFQHLFFYP